MIEPMTETTGFMLGFARPRASRLVRKPNHTVKLPRRFNAASYSAQFVTDLEAWGCDGGVRPGI
jgi:hypothetical protein